MVDKYVNYFYSTISSDFPTATNWDVATDIGDNGLANDIYKTEKYSNALQANWTSADKVAFYERWTTLYQNVRRANDFLSRIDGVRGDENLKNV